MLDDRLLCAASLVRPGSRVADIGTDHAYLPLYLVEQGLCPSAIASDVRPGPADSARRHVSEAGLSDRIAVRLGDGLVGIAPDDGFFGPALSSLFVPVTLATCSRSIFCST